MKTLAGHAFLTDVPLMKCTRSLFFFLLQKTSSATEKFEETSNTRRKGLRQKKIKLQTTTNQSTEVNVLNQILVW